MHVSNIPIDELKPFVKNPKKHPEKQIKFLKKSFKEFGWTNPILVAQDNMIVAGHGRWEAAKQAGFTEVPVIKLDMPYEKAVAYVVADNHLAELAETDNEQLAELLQDISQIEDFDIEATGYEMEDIDEMINELHPNVIIEDEVPEVPDEPITQRGDVWELGRHRLMCGDSTVGDDVGVMMGGALADLVVTDPPYNVDYTGKTEDALKIGNDSMSDSEFYAFLFAAYQQMYDHSVDGAGIYVFHADMEGINFRKSMIDAGYKLSQCCVWVKNSMVMGRQDYHWQHEPVLVGWKPTAAHKWYSDRKQTTVWNFDRPTASRDHPTSKPIELIAYPITNSSERGDVVLDLFGGSGSTLIACEQTNRTNCSMELDPHYCDVIIQRYVNLTGNTQLIRNGEPYTWQAKEQ